MSHHRMLVATAIGLFAGPIADGSMGSKAEAKGASMFMLSPPGSGGDAESGIMTGAVYVAGSSIPAPAALRGIRFSNGLGPDVSEGASRLDPLQPSEPIVPIAAAAALSQQAPVRRATTFGSGGSFVAAPASTTSSGATSAPGSGVTGGVPDGSTAVSIPATDADPIIAGTTPDPAADPAAAIVPVAAAAEPAVIVQPVVLAVRSVAPLAASGAAPSGDPSSVSAVPEPATWLMMITGMALTGLAVRRRDRRARA